VAAMLARSAELAATQAWPAKAARAGPGRRLASPVPAEAACGWPEGGALARAGGEWKVARPEVRTGTVDGGRSNDRRQLDLGKPELDLGVFKWMRFGTKLVDGEASLGRGSLILRVTRAGADFYRGR
jgi:hypothetical protein